MSMKTARLVDRTMPLNEYETFKRIVSEEYDSRIEAKELRQGSQGGTAPRYLRASVKQ